MVNFKSFDETIFVEFSLEMWWRDKKLIGVYLQMQTKMICSNFTT